MELIVKDTKAIKYRSTPTNFCENGDFPSTVQPANPHHPHQGDETLDKSPSGPIAGADQVAQVPRSSMDNWYADRLGSPKRMMESFRQISINQR